MVERHPGDPERDPDAERIARQVTEGVRALREGRASEAAALLAVCDDPAWTAADDLADLRCRAMSLHAQALWLAGRGAEARRRIDAALALARELGDLEGVQEITRLRDEVHGAGANASAALPEPRAAAPAWLPPAEADLEAASRALDAGDRPRAESLARSAIAAVPPNLRVAVLGRLIIARTCPDEAREMLNQAAEIARDAEDATLLGTVARAAELLGEDLGTIRGPDTVAGGSRR